jgi:hypothetical protein
MGVREPIDIHDEGSTSAPQPESNRRTDCGAKVQHQRRRQQAKDHGEVESDERACDSDEGVRDISHTCRGGRLSAEPTAPVSVEHEPDDNSNQENNDEVLYVSAQ